MTVIKRFKFYFIGIILLLLTLSVIYVSAQPPQGENILIPPPSFLPENDL